MTLKTKYADVVLGKDKTRYTIDDSFVKDIKIDPSTMALLIFMKDGTINTFFGCAYSLCQYDDGVDIVMATEVPEIVTAVS